MNSSTVAALGLWKTYEGPETTTGKGRGRMPRGLRRVAVAGLAVALLVGVGTPGVAAADGRAVPLAAARDERPELREAIQEVVDAGFAGVQVRVNDERGEWVDNRFRSYRPEELVRLALSKPARFEPGTDWSYSNTNYTLAQLLIEKVSGRPYGEEMQRRILRPLGMKGTMVPGNRTQLPGPHAHGYYRYQDAGEWKTVDVARQNLSLLAGAGDMLSTTKDLHTYFSALNRGKLIPEQLLAEMRKPHPKSGDFRYGLGLFVQELGPECGGTTILHHNGGPPGGYGALMVSTPDGSKTLTASITTGDAAIDLATEFWKAFNMLAKEVFCGE